MTIREKLKIHREIEKINRERVRRYLEARKKRA